jgi:aspartokinase-like uncharacterized kinase
MFGGAHEAALARDLDERSDLGQAVAHDVSIIAILAIVV